MKQNGIKQELNLSKQLSALLEDKDLFPNISFKIVTSSIRFCCEDFLQFIKIKDTSEKYNI